MNSTTNTRTFLLSFAAGLALALVILFASFASSAQAHTLSVDKAGRVAQSWGNKKVSKYSGYVKATPERCRSLFPHYVECKMGYDTKQTLKQDEYDCVEWIEVYYQAHNTTLKSALTYVKPSPRRPGPPC